MSSILQGPNDYEDFAYTNPGVWYAGIDDPSTLFSLEADGLHISLSKEQAGLSFGLATPLTAAALTAEPILDYSRTSSSGYPAMSFYTDPASTNGWGWISNRVSPETDWSTKWNAAQNDALNWTAVLNNLGTGEINVINLSVGSTGGTYPCNVIIRSLTVGGVTYVFSSDVAPLTVVVSGTPIQPTCDDPTKGKITFTATGGTATAVYAYELWLNGAIVTGLAASDGPNTGVYTGLTAGDYTLKVTDTTDPSLPAGEVKVTLAAEAVNPLKVEAVKGNPTCTNDDGEITITVTGGSGTYTVSGDLADGANTGLAAGSYNILVTDDDCPAVLPVNLTITLDPDYNLLHLDVIEKIDPKCHDGNDGRIVISVSGGNVGDYIFEWHKDGDASVYSTEQNLIDVPAGTYNVIVRASGDGYSCFAELKDLILANPAELVIAAIAPRTFNNGDYVPDYAFTAANIPQGAKFSWEWVSGDQVGSTLSGVGFIPAFYAVNETGHTLTATYKVTLDYETCSSNEVIFTISVNPKTLGIDLDLSIKSIADQTVCEDEDFADIDFIAEHTFYDLTLNTDKLNFEWKLISGINVTDLAVNSDRDEINSGNTYNWVTNGAPKVGTGVYEVTPIWHNNRGISTTFTLTRVAKPVVIQPSDIVLCNEEALKVNFSSPTAGTEFDWVLVSTPSQLGIPALGSNGIDVPKLTNNTAAPITETIKVTPRASGNSCFGDSVTFTVTVLPTPRVNVINNVILANGDASWSAANKPAFQFTGTATAYQWVSGNSAINADNTAPSQGIVTADANGEFYLPQFIAQNINQEPTISKITVTPVYENSGHTCTGTPTEFYVIVASKPTLDAIANKTACENELVSAYSPTGLPSGAGYFITWSGGNTIGLIDELAVNPPALKRSLPPFTTTVPVAGQREDVTITVTPHLYFGGTSFAGTPVTFTYTVLPKIVLDFDKDAAPVIVERCIGEDITNVLTVVATGYNLKYQWYKNHIAIPGATQATYNLTNVDLSTTGIYHVVVTSDCDSKQSRTYNVRIKVPVVQQRWGDVMVLITNPDDNGGYKFSDIRWYKDGVELPGETQSYLYSTEPVEGHEYYVIAITQDGTIYESCPVTGEAYSPVKISIYPNPVKTGETITIDAQLPASDLSSTSIQILSLEGRVLTSLKANGQVTTVAAPNTQGIYLIKVIVGSSSAVYEYKVVVK
ncbi:hypothetical protein FACS189463_1730 [Bacteroidia bacterium]|nr:hypothetical protein FACS189463_1730 [Bacteroidia bacterium]